MVSRLADTAHPVEFATDGDSWSYWLSKSTDQVTIDIDLLYGQIQVGHYSQDQIIQEININVTKTFFVPRAHF